jgi:DNA-directed RNA polymerase specialized sigma24 family protein
MRFVEDLPIKEVAAALDKSEGAVKLLQHRAIKELKKILSA